MGGASASKTLMQGWVRMAFKAFQTATATMKKITTDGAGDTTVSSSFSVDIDPVLGRKRIFTQENEEVSGMQTIISPHDSIDLTHDKWQLEYNGRDYQIEGLTPFYKIGTNIIDHYEVTLR